MKRFLLSLNILLINGLHAQVGINTTEPKAMLDIEYNEDLPATKNQTFGLPQVNKIQRNNFKDVRAGQMIWNTDKNCIDYYDGIFWQCTNGTEFELGINEPAGKCLALVKDRLYGDGVHDFVYCEIEGPDGRIWLNNNLGADYANIHKEIGGSFDPTRQGVDRFDVHSYGSLFQWQRSADGHELIDWEGEPRSINGADGSIASSWENAGTNQFIKPDSSSDWSWVDSSTNGNGEYNHWQLGGATNPCPKGFYVPTVNEWEAFLEALGSGEDRVWFDDKALKLPAAGVRNDNDASISTNNYRGYYWSSSNSNDKFSHYMEFYANRKSDTGSLNVRAFGFSIRCIKS